MNYGDLPTEAVLVHDLDPVRFGDEVPGHGECVYCGAQVSPETTEPGCAAFARYRRWEQRELEWEADPEWAPTGPFGPQRRES